MLYKFDNQEPVIGVNTYVSETAIVVGDVRIGDECYIGHGSILRGDYGTIEINSGTAVEEGAIMHAPPNETCRLGQKVTIGHGAIVHSKEIEDKAVIGMGAVISIWVTIGKMSIVGEGTVVPIGKKFPESVVIAGNPAKIVREVRQKDIDNFQWVKQLYIDLSKKYLEKGIHLVR